MTDEEDTTVLRQVAEIVARQFRTDASRITGETAAFDVDGWDSMTHTLLLMRIEKAFGVRIGPAEGFAAANVARLAALVSQLRRTQ